MAMVEEIFATRTTADWLGRLQAAGVPATPIQAVDRVLVDPQVRHRRMVVDVPHPAHGTLPTLGTPVKVDGAVDLTPAPPPGLGEHTDRVLRDMLAYPQPRIDALRREGTIR